MKSGEVAARTRGVRVSSSSLVRLIASSTLVPAGFDAKDGAEDLPTAIKDILILFRRNKLDQQTWRLSQPQKKSRAFRPRH